MPEERFLNEKTKRYLLGGLILIVILVSVSLLIKFFVLRPPSPWQPPELPSSIKPGSPEEAAIRYLQWVQEGKKKESEEYLYPTPPLFPQVTILREKYRDVRENIIFQSIEKEGSPPEYQVKESKIKDKIAKVTIEEITNNKEGSFLFGFVLMDKITFNITLAKSEEKWKIIDVDSPDLILDKKIRGEAEIGKNVFMKLIEVEDYMPEEVQPQKGTKLFSLLVKYENRSKDFFSPQPFSEWKVVLVNGEFYSPLPPTAFSGLIGKLNPLIRRPALLLKGGLKPGSTEKGYISFSLPQNNSIRTVVFQNLFKKVIFEIPQELPTR